ncbi:hypothetical protein P154DRAFT_520422 [Amniculicola lignicola CBS 123094]|uniref:BTB domain-containing protein n=1 Tax=Amniculicola lignicola CBS 123094 TaxID=1392246 RepID=A0A6A5WMY0_9PLEO|nr:hypothetical protein P154DRAFT_520422 [Amniculicola lignicola CBS 123094]
MPELPKDKPLNELLSRTMVDLYVGPENTHWILHEKLLCHHSPFFRKVFYNKTHPSKTFGLPDEEDGPFKLFVGWLYSSSLPQPREEADLQSLFDLYLMSEKFGMGLLIQDVLQTVREFYKYSDTYPGLRRIQYIYANTEDGSPMRFMMVNAVARMLVLGKEGIPRHWDKALKKNGQLAVDLLRAIQEWGLDEESIPDAREDPEQAEELVDPETVEGEDPEGIEVQAEEGEAEDEGEEQEEDIKEQEDEEVEPHDEDDDTVVESPHDVKDLGQLGQVQKKGSDLVNGISKLGLKAIPNGITNGDYGTLH